MPLSCPIPLNDYPQVLLAHGGGGKLMRNLIDKMLATLYEDSDTNMLHDGATLALKGDVVFTTDSFVVSPRFFPGGDIASLAVNGTVNDLAVSGADPEYLSVAFIIEEGFSMQELWQVVNSMAEAAKQAGVKIVTGDTKVVERGKGDGIFINTAGVGSRFKDANIHASNILPGDRIILSGDLGRHGVAIMAKREGLSFETDIRSDCAPLNHAIKAIFDAKLELHCMRDLTRGGLGSAAVELASASNCSLLIKEELLPICNPVRGACEMLGLDPLYIANEGCFIAFAPEHSAEKIVNVLKKYHETAAACIAGEVLESDAAPGLVQLQNAIGTRRIIDMLSGEQLPRIC